MKYKRIDLIDYSNEKELELLLLQIAKWHNQTPQLWIPGYKPSEKDLEETIQRIRSTNSEDLFIAIAEDDLCQIQGFIWAYKQKKPQDSIMILSLYTSEEYRKCGIASNLKILLEEWCKNEGIKIVQTTVHYNNDKMIALNKKLGYLPGMVSMTKRL